MSAISALKGYRTQFLYSLYYILKNQDTNYQYRLEGTEDIDVINSEGNVEYYIQVKNLKAQITLSDLFKAEGTSFIRRYLELGSKGVPVLVSFGELGTDLQSWRSSPLTVAQKEKSLLQKFKISESDWLTVKKNLVFEIVNEDSLFVEIYGLLKGITQIDPEPTLENLMYWLFYVAEKQKVIGFKDVFEKIEHIATYLSERIAITNRYGIFIKPLHQTDLEAASIAVLQKEYHYGAHARYEHILAGQDVVRYQFLKQITDCFEQSNVVLIHGASGQGKTSLAYRYALNHSPSALIYEIIAQENVIATYEAVLALQAILKKLDVPVLLIINVSPNTFYWLRIIEALSIFKDLRFVVTIRNEDWFRAKSSEVNFTYSEIELALSENEAEQIYKELLKKEHQSKYSDFKEAWIDQGENSPLMEFTYSILQGDSLSNRLQQQVLLLNTEELKNELTGQIDFLRIVSLADYSGARVLANKLKSKPGIQFIIQKFEREYLLKFSTDKKYLTGLHPIRSKLLCDLLFDDFVSTRKDTVINCLEVIEEMDIYPFLLKCLYDQVITAEELIDIAVSSPQLSWVAYGSYSKSLLWAGAKDFINENRGIFDDAYRSFGMIGIMLLDIFHGTSIDLSSIFSMVDPDKKIEIDRLNHLLTPKTAVFKHMLSFFQNVPVPSKAASSAEEWLYFAESLFWTAQLIPETDRKINMTEQQCQVAFEKLEVGILSKLMLGLHHYSSAYDQLRVKFSPVFVEKICRKYLIADIKIDDEVTVNYVLDVINEKESFSVHDQVLEIIDLLHEAFPDKKKFNSQAHGHRNLMIQLPFDDSSKSISAENLVFEEWSTLNAMIRKIHEYECRPDTWIKFVDELQLWEKDVKKILYNFSESFATLKHTNSSKLTNVMEQSRHNFGFEIKPPKSISDPFGLHIKTSKVKSNTLDIRNGSVKEKTLTERHEHFFKSYRDFKSGIENFLRQSGEVVYQLLKNTEEPELHINDHTLHISYVNLFNAIEHREAFITEKQKSLKDLLKGNLVEITEIELFKTATIWKGFNVAFFSKDFKNLSLKEKITGIKTDLETAIQKTLRKLVKDTGYSIRYVNNKQTDYKPVIILDAPSSGEVLLAISQCYGVLKEAINKPDYNSLKYLVVQRYFKHVYMVPLIKGRTFNHNYYRFPEYLFRDSAFNELKLQYLMTIPMPEPLIENLGIESWIDLTQPMRDIYLLHSEYVNLRLMVEHLADLKHFDQPEILDANGHELVVAHLEKIKDKLQPSFQTVLDRLTEIIKFHEHNQLDLESEQMYLTDMLHIKDNIFPTSKGDETEYQAYLKMDIIVNWAKRLEALNESWGRFTLILQNKALQHYFRNLSE